MAGELAKTFTEQQQSFVALVSSGIDPTEAAAQSGYASNNGRVDAWRLMRQPAIVAAIHLEVARRLALGAPIALKFLQDTVQDSTVDKRLRAAIAKTLLDRAGYIPPRAAAPGNAGETPLNEMTMGELRTLADKLEGEIAGRAKPVSSASAAPKGTQAIEDII